MTRALGVWLWATAMAALAGCVPTPHVGVFQANGFYSLRDYYRVRYPAEGVAGRRLLPPPWRLEGYRLDHGVPGLAVLPRGARLEDQEDFAYENTQDQAVVFARTFPVEPELADRPLDLFMTDALAALERTRFRDRHAAVRVLERGPALVGGAEAQRAVFDLFAVSARLDASTTGGRAYLVVVRPTPWTWDDEHERRSASGRPMLLLLGLVAGADSFDRHVTEFEGLLDRIDVRAPNVE